MSGIEGGYSHLAVACPKSSSLGGPRVTAVEECGAKKTCVHTYGTVGPCGSWRLAAGSMWVGLGVGPTKETKETPHGRHPK